MYLILFYHEWSVKKSLNIWPPNQCTLSYLKMEKVAVASGQEREVPQMKTPSTNKNYSEDTVMWLKEIRNELGLETKF